MHFVIDIPQMLHLFATVVLLLSITSVNGITVEAEDSVYDRDKIQTKWRNKASNSKTVLLKPGNGFQVEFCVVSETILSLKELRYSNVGFSDTLSVKLDGKKVGTLKTQVANLKGDGWNYFRKSKPISFPIKAGRHKLSIKAALSDRFGVEIDKLEIVTENSQSDEEFRCNVFCLSKMIPSIGQVSKTARNLSKRKSCILQKSVRTKCAEEDNINIPIFSENLETVKITTSIPEYPSFANHKGADFTNCDQVASLWTFEDIIFISEEEHMRHNFHKASVGIKHTKHVQGNVAALISNVNTKRKFIKVKFKLEGETKGVVDADIGSVLCVRFKYIDHYSRIYIRFKGRSEKWEKLAVTFVDKDILTREWNFPDFTWSDKSENIISMEVFSYSRDKHFEIDKLELKRRAKNKTAIIDMFSNNNFLMEGANIDFWWLINQTMSVRILDNGQIFQNIDYFRIYAKVPWKRNHFSQIFVLYQDGNVRLLPVSPHGLDWIPFGSSILIGQTDPLSPRPSAPIQHVDISFKDQTVRVLYKDGGFIVMKIGTHISSTTLEIQDGYLAKDKSQHPFLTFRSMWVANGNADVDHVSVDGSVSKIMSKWDRLYGSTFLFFRRCISKHNTQSPDIFVETDFTNSTKS